ncbi:hypothetical protein Q5762_22410 [Streptomyces sp. P9(2023)]|uniref:hypothetical protein n=1 Tax=Streptomyces sp. P9(2023) TaxID=3064394 RepID=UPI0028F417DC|nr:hypothetical protein [Streptomyces sp. P9(2023)]MDT9691050.1 hypothetical protein [Streptomyces sp. P9(2023)]
MPGQRQAQGGTGDGLEGEQYGPLPRLDPAPAIGPSAARACVSNRRATRDFTTNHPASELPCDDKGNRRAA